MPPARVIYLLRQACDALREAHDSGLIHRDIKPANLMAAYRGGHYDVTKLLDFGLVKTLSEDDSIHLSQEGTVAGSPLYMAPEQVMHNQPPDRRTDIYGLGAVAYFMLTGRPPFLGDNADGGHGCPCPRPGHSRRRRSGPSIPADLEAVVLRCLAKKPGRSLSRHAEPRRGPRWPAPTPRTGRPSTPPTGGRPTRVETPNLIAAAGRDRNPNRAPSRSSKPVSESESARVAPHQCNPAVDESRPDPIPSVDRAHIQIDDDAQRTPTTDESNDESGCLDDGAARRHDSPGVRLRHRRRDRPRSRPADPPGRAGPVAAAAPHARIDRLSAGADPGRARARRHRAAGRVVVAPAARAAS